MDDLDQIVADVVDTAAAYEPCIRAFFLNPARKEAAESPQGIGP